MKVQLTDYEPKGSSAQEEAFEEWYKSPNAQMGFVRKQAFIDGWKAAEFEHGRENARLRAEVRALKDLQRMQGVAKEDEAAQSAFIDALAAEVESLGSEEAALHYAAAVANWHYALDLRDTLERRARGDGNSIDRT